MTPSVAGRHRWVISVWYLLGVMFGVVAGYSESKATPLNIQDMVIGRCEEYQRALRPELFKDGLKNCTDVWVKFRKAFAYKDPCNVTVDSYREFIETAFHKIDTENKVMYWSGMVYPMVINFARVKSDQYITIREILPAYVIRNVDDWCGQIQDPGINYRTCPAWGTCPLLATTSFWTALSKAFAKEVKGTVHLMLNGSSFPAYRNTSIFAQSELKNLEASRTPSMHVHLAYTLNGPTAEKCDQGSLVELRQDVEKKGMKFKCTDNDVDLLLYQCVVDSMKADKCKRPVGSKASRLLPSSIVGFLIAICFLSVYPGFTKLVFNEI